jgi:ABC-type antimicrobial peptide transport system permease subunit
MEGGQPCRSYFVCAKEGQAEDATVTEGGKEVRLVEVEQADTVISALGHDWGEATYTWSQNDTACTASHACKRDASHTATEKATEEISEILRRNHKLREATDDVPGDDDDFNIRSQEELASMMNSTTDMLTILLGAVAGISLIVGGIGIMNIMYVSVTERTREIGLRMSVGARGIDILNQFLIEAIMLSVTGGIIGVLLGVSLSYAINSLAHWPIYIQPWSIVMSFAVCTLTGVFFGWYPAKKAARLDPIEAIRYE